MTITLAPNKKTTGIDHNHWERLAVTTVGFPQTAQVGFKFRGGIKDIILTLEGGTTVAYSFNGNTVHGELISGTTRAQVYLLRRPAAGIWFKLLAPGAGTVTIEAWASQ